MLQNKQCYDTRHKRGISKRSVASIRRDVKMSKSCGYFSLGSDGWLLWSSVAAWYRNTGGHAEREIMHHMLNNSVN